MDQILTGTDAGELILVSSDASGAPGDNYSRNPVFSPDGTKVVFQSAADSLVPGDTNGVPDIFMKELTTGEITRISVDASGQQANGASIEARFSPDGGKIVFSSAATDLVAQDTQGHFNIFVKDLSTGLVTLVSTASGGATANSDSASPSFFPDGSRILFTSYASNLSPGDTNAAEGVFIKDLNTGVTTSVSGQASHGTLPAVSPDGTKVAFLSIPLSDPNARWDIAVEDQQTGAVTIVSTDTTGGSANHNSSYPAWLDSSHILFQSWASNLVAGDTGATLPDVFVKDLTTGGLTLVSSDASGAFGDDSSYKSAGFLDGAGVAFESLSTNFVPGDTNGAVDIFVKTLATEAVTRVTADSLGAQISPNSFLGSVSPDGERVAFYTWDSQQLSAPQVYVKIIGSGDDTLHGGPGNDTIFGKGGNDLLDGAAGDARFSARRATTISWRKPATTTSRVGTATTLSTVERATTSPHTPPPATSWSWISSRRGFGRTLRERATT